MTKDHPPAVEPVPLRAPRRIDSRVPPDCKSISLIVPEKLYYRLQTEASRHCRSLPDYLFAFLLESHPLDSVSAVTPPPSVETG